MITNNSVVEIENLVMNHESGDAELNPAQDSTYPASITLSKSTTETPEQYVKSVKRKQ